MIYLDASVVVPIIIVESTSFQVDAWLATRPDICLSQWTVSEVTSALSHHLRTGRLKPESRVVAETMLDHWVSLNTVVEIDDEDIVGARALLRFDPSLRTPDALHLAIASRLAGGLATYDRRLATAARAIGVEVISP